MRWRIWPYGVFTGYAAWLVLVAIAFNLTRTSRIVARDLATAHLRNHPAKDPHGCGPDRPQRPQRPGS